jgi:hypothetical protein
MIQSVTKKDRSKGAKEAERLRKEKEAADAEERAGRRAEQERSREEFEEDATHKAMTRTSEQTPVTFANAILGHFSAITIQKGHEFLPDGKAATPRGRIRAANALLKAHGYPQIADSQDWIV